MLTVEEKSMEKVKELTVQFFELHWNWDKVYDSDRNDKYWTERWLLYKGLKGALPYGERHGCYALVQNEEVVYVHWAWSSALYAKNI